MAIYHFSAKVISRSSGSSAVASAAYRSASRLHDKRLDRSHDFTNKAGVIHSEVMLPEGAPERLSDRSTLWNEVEAAELRKDAQLTREVEFAIPREMTQQQSIELARNFVQEQFVDQGMIADLNVHWDIGADGLAKPHAHVMLTMRQVGEDGFGAKARDWNKSELVCEWREAWETHVNERLAELDIDARIDHRSLEAQGIALEPQNKIGPAASRMAGHGLEAERIAEHAEIARRNGDKIIANPNIALDAITHNQSTFTKRDLAMFVHPHSDGKDQFDLAMAAVQESRDMVALGRDGKGDERFTSRGMIEVEARLEQTCEQLALRQNHGVPEMGSQIIPGTPVLQLSDQQQSALSRITKGPDIALVIGYAGTGKSTMLAHARGAWEDAGYQVRGSALSGIAAENLEAGSSIASRTIASMEHGWQQGRDLLTSRDVLVIDEAGMVGTRQMERVLSHARDAGAKVILVGDPQQLQAIEAGAAFRSIAEQIGSVEITEIRRQREDWQRDATRHLATGRTAEALEAYRDHDMLHSAKIREAARGELIDKWDRERVAKPDDSRIVLTHTNDEVRELNLAARDRLRASGELGSDIAIQVERGERSFATGDRVMFLRNERELGVKNGSLGTLQSVNAQRMAVLLDDGRSVAFDTKSYAHIDHGYAATIHKSQGVTVDRTYVLATPGMDQHSSYVALSRHRESVQIHYGRDDFADDGKLARTLSRERTKDMASDYGRETATDPARRFAERRGITFRERVAEVIRKVPEKVRGLFDGFRLPETQPPEPDRQVRAQAAFRRHARAVSDLLRAQEDGTTISKLVEQGRYAPMGKELNIARNELNAFGANYSGDVERAYLADQPLAREAAGGNVRRAILTMKNEQELRETLPKRANRFVTRWQQLEESSQQSYARGDMSAYKTARSSMAGMAKSLERDPQLESLLANRKRELGIDVISGRSLGRELAFSHGLEIGRGRGLGL